MQNLFTPAFGGLPQIFFGRVNELAFAQKALDNANSPHRAFFITGNRGCGKTTLLEKISHIAGDAGWMTIDVHSSHASRAIVEALVGGAQRTVAKNVSPRIMGVELGGTSTSTTTEFTETSLGRLLIERCSSLTLHKGILITVDEIQKVPESDAENLCSAVQLSLRKGLPIMLALAGLPNAKEKVASYPGCTFMQRAFDMKIGCLLVDETIEAFKGVFAKMPELRVSDDAIWEAGVFSQGYPYLMQLLGYYAVERAHERMVAGIAEIDVAHLHEVEPLAMASYRENVLVPILGQLPDSLSGFLQAACDEEDEQGRVSTAAVANRLGKKPSQVSSYRQRLIDKRLIEPDGQGYARFLLPHIREYYQGETAALERVDTAQLWNRYSPSEG